MGVRSISCTTWLKHTRIHTVTNAYEHKAAANISTQVGTCHSQCADSIYCLWTDWKDASAALRLLLLRKLWENGLITWATWITRVAVNDGDRNGCSWSFLDPSWCFGGIVFCFFFDSFFVVMLWWLSESSPWPSSIWVLCKPSTSSTNVHEMFLFFSPFTRFWGLTKWNRM